MRGTSTAILRLALAAALVAPRPVLADVALSGLADVVFHNSGEEDITNVSFGGASPLQALRTRIFLDSHIEDDIAFFAQVLYADDEIGLYGAYARFSEIAGSPVNLHVGLIPTPVGTFAERTYSDKNPLVGTPLVHNHHTSLNPTQTQNSVDDLLAARDVRDRMGLPVIYDNCWNTGVETFGQIGPIDWSFAAVSGSMTKPTREQMKQAPQGTGRIGWWGGPGLQVGASGWVGPYLWEDMAGITFPEGKSSNDFLNAGAGGDLHVASRYVDVYSEAYWSRWKHPGLPVLTAVSGYLEAKYKFATRWYGAGRAEFFEPSEVTSGTGAVTTWDYPVRRLEYGLGFRPHRRVLTKLVAQHNRFVGSESFDSDHYLVQLSTAF
jgi:hypothetical protein